ncbi:MAG: DNA-binding protein [Providencia sp.]
MSFFLGLLLLLVILIVICRIRALRHIAKHTITEKDLKTFREYNDIVDYEKEAKQAVYEVIRCKTIFDKLNCYVDLRMMFESLHADYCKYEKVNPLLMEALRRKFTFAYSAFITPYPEPIEESGLERLSLIHTKKHCPEYIWKHIIEAAVYTNEELDEYFEMKEFDPLDRMCTDMELYKDLMGTVLYDDVMGCFIYEENDSSTILDNEFYTVSKEQLNQWLDEELAFISYLTESLLNICIEYIRKEKGIIRI